MYEMLKEFIKPELWVSIPVLYLCGNGFKKSQIAGQTHTYALGRYFDSPEPFIHSGYIYY